jgi:hypothetical protein
MIFGRFPRLTGVGHRSQIRPQEHVENHGRACTQVRFLRNMSKIMEGPVLRCVSFRKAELRFFDLLEIVTGSVVPSAGQKIPLAENRFFQAGRELQIQRKNTGSALCLSHSIYI